MPRQEIRHLSGSGPRPARPSVRIGDCTARAGNGRKRTIPGRRAGHWRRGQLQDLSRGRRPPAPGRAPGLPRPPLHGVGQPVRYDGNRRVHSNRPSGPKERFLSCSPTSGCSLGNGSPMLSRSGGGPPSGDWSRRSPVRMQRTPCIFSQFHLARLSLVVEAEVLWHGNRERCAAACAASHPDGGG